MKFDEAVQYIKSLDVYGSVLGLDSMRALAKELNNPEAGLKFIHVTGTNGKGSICAFLSNILTAAGYKTGTYNSPAVISDTDQYLINTSEISHDLFAEAVTLVKDACDKIIQAGLSHPTRFEVETMVAFTAFNLEKCDVVVLETGLGGRDDATNIVDNTILHIFSSITLDHIGILGSTKAEIALVKSGIIKGDSPVLAYGGHSPEDAFDDVINVIKDRCIETGSKMHTVYDSCVSDVHLNNKKLMFSIEELDMYDIAIKMTGEYQPVNAAMAIYASRLLNENGFAISDENIRNGLKLSKIPFRFERLKAHTDDNRKVDIILDGAHNPDGADRLVKSLSLNFPDREFIFITGIFKDKDYEEIARITGGIARTIYVVENDLSRRALPKDELADVFRRYNDTALISDSIESAIDSAIAKSLDDSILTAVANSGLFLGMEQPKKPVIVCFGSLSWLNRAKEYIKGKYGKIIIEEKPSEDKMSEESMSEEKAIVTDEKPISANFEIDGEKIRQGIRLILEGIGEDINREGLIDTPDRVVRMYEEIFSGIGKTAEYDLSRTFSATSKDIVLEKDITFYSMCEHHLMPFYGKAHIAYIPDGKVVGISKLARCVEVYAKKPQIQEKLTEEIADAIMTYLKPKGVMVMLEAEHMCMTMRGVKKPGTKTVTVTARGRMKKKDNQDMFFNLLGKQATE